MKDSDYAAPQQDGNGAVQQNRLSGLDDGAAGWSGATTPVEQQTMPSTRETILLALHALLQTQSAPVLRGEVLPERVPAAGLLILRDGDPGEPAVTLSPLRYHYQHRAEVEAIVQAGAGRDAAFDVLAAGVGTALAADRTLGGRCDWVEAEAPRPTELGIDGAATLKAAVLPIVLHYSTSDPLA